MNTHSILNAVGISASSFTVGGSTVTLDVNGTVRLTGITDTVNWNSRAFYKGPGAWNTDMSAFKNFSITEKVKLRFTADFFNAFNHAQFKNPDSTVGDANFGQVTQARDAREVQLGLKLLW